MLPCVRARKVDFDGHHYVIMVTLGEKDGMKTWCKFCTEILIEVTWCTEILIEVMKEMERGGEEDRGRKRSFHPKSSPSIPGFKFLRPGACFAHKFMRYSLIIHTMICVFLYMSFFVVKLYFYYHSNPF